MKKQIWIIVLAVGLLATGAMAQTLDPAGTYEVTVSGFDNGLAVVTLAADGSITGYGLTAKSDGLFDISGDWSEGSKNTITGTLGTDIYGGIPDGPFAGKIQKNGHITAKWGTGGESVNLTGKLATSVPAVAGTWFATVRDRYGVTQDQVDITADATGYAVFDFSDSLGDASGTFIINSQGKIYANGAFLGEYLTAKGQSNAGATRITITGKGFSVVAIQ